MGEGGSQVEHRISEQPCFALYSASNAITRAYRPLLEPLGLTYPQYVVMMTLWEEDGIDLNTLAQRALVDSSGLTPVIKRLEQRGLLSRSRLPEDERRLVITVTAAGGALQVAAKDVPRQMLCQVGLTPEQERAVLSACADIRSALMDRPSVMAPEEPPGIHYA